MDIVDVTRRIEELATGRPFGELQTIRERLKGKRQLGPGIFRPQTTFRRTVNGRNGSYAFHFGGRKELQFNIGFEDGGTVLRYGVAFSFKGSRSLQNLDLLEVPVRRFNRFVSSNPAYFSSFRMWVHEKNHPRSDREFVSPIDKDLFRWGPFIFVGNIQPAKIRSVDYGRILDDFDWLMPLYEFVEGKDKVLPVKQTKSGFVFRPGCSIHKFSAKSVSNARVTDIDLRHKRIQVKLHSHLTSRYGNENVGLELPQSGTRIDAVLRQGKKYWYYEIKTSESIKACIRQSLSQLLEYSYWPGSHRASKLIIVGEQPIDQDSSKYLSIMRTQFKLPVEYQQFDMKTGKLVDA